MQTIPIVFENDDILIINKMQGVSVQGGKSISHSIDDMLSLQLNYKIFLVHRLDKETAGLLLVAKNSLAARTWQNKMQNGFVKKEYDAICFGFLEKKNATLTDKIIQHGEKKIARLQYSVTKEFSFANEKFSLVHITLETGRMHQIRIQFAKRGHHIVGDDLHGDFKKNKLLKKNLGVKNLLLCSSALSFFLDATEKKITIDLPPSMKTFLENCENKVE